MVKEPEAVCVEPEVRGAVLRDSPWRSLLKGLTWRLLATFTTMLVAWGITSEAEVAVKIAGLEFFAKLGIYYFHERAWARVPLGTVRRAFHLESPVPDS